MTLLRGSAPSQPWVGDQIDWTSPQARGLVGCWPLNDGGGATARDLVGRAKGTLVNGPTWGIGRNGNALTFSGGSYVDIGNNAAFSPTSISISLFVKIASLANATNCIYNKQATAFHQINILNTGKLQLYFNVGGSLVGYNGTGTYTLSTGVWYHVVSVFDEQSGGVGYVNGYVDKSYAVVGQLLNNTASGTIGMDTVNAGRAFSGPIADFRIYNRALSAKDVIDIYTRANELYRRSSLIIPAGIAQPQIWRNGLQATGIWRNGMQAIDVTRNGLSAFW